MIPELVSTDYNVLFHLVWQPNSTNRGANSALQSRTRKKDHFFFWSDFNKVGLKQKLKRLMTIFQNIYLNYIYGFSRESKTFFYKTHPTTPFKFNRRLSISLLKLITNNVSANYKTMWRQARVQMVQRQTECANHFLKTHI